MNIGKKAFFISSANLVLTFLIVFFSIERGGIPFAIFAGWFCFLVFIFGFSLSLRAVALNYKAMGALAILMSILHLPLFLTFRHVL